jgi:pre-rRNA-processing protein RIX1
MAPQTTSVSLLRAASFRIANAAKPDVPQVAALTAQSLLSCKDLFTHPDLATQKDSDAALALHRFNTQITSLLGDRTVEGRWAAVVLIKATIEAGGWETLKKSIAWVRGLLILLKKPDPPLLRCLTIVTLTRIFMLTWEFPTLIREITTPSLPSFVATCLSNLLARPCTPQQVKATLECFAQLLPRHPTIFRQNQDAITKLVTVIFENKASSHHVMDLASRISVLLHQCEPKNGASEKWEATFIATLHSAHAMADRTFMSVEEDWQSVTGTNFINKHLLSELYSKAQDATNSPDGPVGQFISPGHGGLINHLRLLAAYFASVTSASVAASLGAVTDLLTRLMSITISSSSTKSSIRFRRDAAREERDALTEVLPQIHVACIELLSIILDRYGSSLMSAMQTFIDQIMWVFHASSSNVQVRTAIYVVGKKVLDYSGQSLNKQAIASLKTLMTACCEDLLPNQEKKPDNSNANKQQSTLNADTFLKQATTISSAKTKLSGLQSAAWELLPRLVGQVPAEHCSMAMRAMMDRTAVLCRHKDAVMASTLNHTSTAQTARKGNSLLPLLAREYPTDPQVEVLLRPRMPIIQTGCRATKAESDGMDEDEESSSEEEEEDGETVQSGVTRRGANMSTEERNRVASAMRPSNSPEATSQGKESPSDEASSKDVAHKEQDLVNWALNEYVRGGYAQKDDNAAAGSADATNGTETSDGAVSAALYGDETARLPEGDWSRSDEVQRGKRQREDDEEKAADKRQKSTEPQGVEEDSDDEDFVIPEIVMGDSDDEDE